MPAHTSMLTGTEPDVHGVTWNDELLERYGHITTPTIFGMAKQAGFGTAAFFSKAKLIHLAVPGTLDTVRAPRNFDTWSADRTIDYAERYIEQAQPNLLFVHIGDPDRAGHDWGWMSIAYGLAVREADDEITELLLTADRVYGRRNYTAIITADHGGHDRDHRSDDPRDVTIPWIAWGKGVEPGVVLPGIRTMDTAATVLWLLGVTPPPAVVGRPVLPAFAAPLAVSR